jgi:DNA-binding response OmpR family regulator
VFQLKRYRGRPTLPREASGRPLVLRHTPTWAAALQVKHVDILIYEEDHLTRNLLKQWLGEAGYRVRLGMPRECGIGSPADLVIVNVSMPKHAGAQCIRNIQAAHPNTPLIAISAQFRSGLSAAGATAQSLGVQQVIAKPLVRADLLEAVRGIGRRSG